MALYILDVASYQGDLKPADVARAGFGAVNVKVSHGLGTKSVHPQAASWVKGPSGLAVSTFHFLTGEASGAAQAQHCYDRMRALGVPASAAHQLDTEADADWQIISDYARAMQRMLGRPIVIYTGDWWWTAAGRNWRGADLTPYVWSAPNVGYLGSYPGDTSVHWRAGYGGWAALAVMQYAVAPLSFPDGTKGSIDVSKSAIRDPAVWSTLTQGRPPMSYAPDSLKAARTFYIRTLTDEAGYKIDPLAVGIVGDDSHANSGTSYHLGKDALKPTAYSIVESPRDRDGLSGAAMALDLGWFSFKVGGVTHNLRTFSKWLVEQCEANTPDTRDIREVIYSLDGKTVKRWDRLGRRTTGDSSHTTHTHESWFRDSEDRDKTAHLRRYFTEIGVLESEEDLPVDQAAFNTLMTNWVKQADFIPGYNRDGSKVPAVAGDPAANTYTVNTLFERVGRMAVMMDPDRVKLLDQATADAVVKKIRTTFPVLSDSDRAALATAVAAALAPRFDAQADAVAAVLTNVQADDNEVGQVLAAIEAAKTGTASAVIEQLGSQGRSNEEVAEMLQAILGDRAAAVGALLTR